MLQEKPVTAKNSCAEGLLESHADLNLWCGAEKSLAMDHVLVPGCDLDGHDMPGKLGGERQFAGKSHGAVFRHENRSAAGHAFDYTEEPASAGELRMRSHLDRGAHPGEFSGFRDDGLVGLEDEFQ